MQANEEVDQASEVSEVQSFTQKPGQKRQNQS